MCFRGPDLETLKSCKIQPCPSKFTCTVGLNLRTGGAPRPSRHMFSVMTDHQASELEALKPAVADDGGGVRPVEFLFLVSKPGTV